jgi:hypothetical protein
MSPLAGPYLASAVLLVAAGAPKVLRPGYAVRALVSLGWPAAPVLVRLLGLVEALIGLAAVLVGGAVPAALVGASYAAFSGFVAWALRRGGVLSSCGCFGRADTPPTRVHVVLTVTFTAVALAVATRPLRPLLDVPPGTPATGLPLIGFTALGAWLAYLLLAVAPRSTGRAIAPAGGQRAP